MVTSLKGPSLSDSVRKYVKDYIIENDLQPGDPLPSEGELAEILGVGRSSIREAVKSLESLGIVEVRHGEGLFVREWNFDPFLETLCYGLQFNPNNFQELLQIRIWLESAMIGEVVESISQDQINALNEIMKAWKKRIGCHETFYDLDENFHRTLYSNLSNQTVIELIGIFWQAFLTMYEQFEEKPDAAVEYEAHQKILDALTSQSIHESRKALIESFTNVTSKMLEIVPKAA